MLLKVIDSSQISERMPVAVDPEAETIASGVLKDIMHRGEDAVREYAQKFGDIPAGAPLVIPNDSLKEAFENIPEADRALLERVANRIRTFAEEQLGAIKDIKVPIPGGFAGHQVAPVERAGCYAPGGRFPLPSSVLMTAVTARAAGVKEVWVASPKPSPVTLAAAYVAGVDGFLAAGGAQAIGAFAYGGGQLPGCDVIVGPGNKFVTAAKKIVSGHVAIDMLAGPSELTVLADESADPQTIAADLLAQGEHDVDAVPILVTDCESLIGKVEEALAEQLEVLKTGETAREALKNGFAVLVDNLDEGVAVCNKLAPEHLELLVAKPDDIAKKCSDYGGLFIGEGTAEVLGDYGAGPNHTLPTGGTARYTGGLSVFDFLRIRTWIKVENSSGALQLVEDAQRLAELEGLDGHAKSAARRLTI